MTLALALNCSLKPSPANSSTERLAREVLEALGRHGVEGDLVRVVDFDIKPGVTRDMGAGDEWPELHARVMAADILILATPTWLGHMSSVAQRVLERLDADLSETDEAGRPVLSSKVAIAVVVGNEDGAHKIVADTYQALNDVGFNIPSQGCTYWNGEAMHKVDFQDVTPTPDEVAHATEVMAGNAAHLARLLREHPYPV